MKVNIFNIHHEVVAYMEAYSASYEHLDLIQRHQLAERYASDFFREIQFSKEEEKIMTPLDLMRGTDVEYDIINDDLYDEISAFIEGRKKKPINPREV